MARIQRFNFTAQHILILLFVFSAGIAQAQVNAHAKVTNISGATLGLSDVNESFDSFEVGEQVIVMQMQDDVLGGNTGNNASFGDLNTIASAGLYEVTTISAVNEVGGVPTSVELFVGLNFSYQTGVNSSVQLISFPDLGSGSDYITESNISAVNWDGNVGGVVAFQVNGALTLAHSITADQAGFRGGANDGGGSAGCTSDMYRISSNTDYGQKGEGIYHNNNSNYTHARGKLLSGGGGGNSHNAGGGGGGNFSEGGMGGAGWPNCSPSAGGLGGISLGMQINANRVFLGGGGGAGEMNNTGPSAGANGGGIILIKADSLRTQGGCGSLLISAEGGSAGSSTQDGAGGGGAGGSVVLEVGAFDVAASCPLTVRANGGDGGDVNHSSPHGGGGGGGLGAVIYSIVEPTMNVATETNPGTGGDNNTGGSGGAADPGAGVSGTGQGVIDQRTGGPLPIELGRFAAVSENNSVLVQWTTLTEINNDFFTIQRSADGINYEDIAYVNGAGNSQTALDYDFTDKDPLAGRSYYRLRQTDFDGQFEVFLPQAVYLNNELDPGFIVYPNPAAETAFLRIPEGSSAVQVQLFDRSGRMINLASRLQMEYDRAQIDLNGLAEGLYLLRFTHAGQVSTRKLVVKRF